MRDWVTNVRDTYYLLGSALGAHPYPMMVRDFHRVIGEEARAQILEQEGRLPDAIVACVGGGSNAIGVFHAFIAGQGRAADRRRSRRPRHGAGRACGALPRRRLPGVLQGAYSYVLQDDAGQVALTHSVCAGLDYASVGPEHALLHDSGRAEYTSATDAEALAAARTLARTEGIMPALESAHAVAEAHQARAEDGEDGRVDGEPLRPRRQGYGHSGARDGSARLGCAEEGARSMPICIPEETGPRRLSHRRRSRPRDDARDRAGRDRRGADLIELGVPFSDPLADGPVIQRASERAVARGVRLTDVLGVARELRAARPKCGIVIFSYLNPVVRMGMKAFCAAAKEAGVDGVLLTDMIVEEADEYLADDARERSRAGLPGRAHQPRCAAEADRRSTRTDSSMPSRAWALPARAMPSPATRLDLVARLREIHAACPSPSASASRTPSTCAPWAQFADAAVVGSAFVALIEKTPAADAPAAVGNSSRSCAR